MLLAVGFGAAARLLREAVPLPFAALPEAGDFVLLLVLPPEALPDVWLEELPVAFPFANGFFAVDEECAGFFSWAATSSGAVKASREPIATANATFVQLLNIASLCKKPYTLYSKPGSSYLNHRRSDRIR
jgi:hypothetical protein